MLMFEDCENWVTLTRLRSHILNTDKFPGFYQFFFYFDGLSKFPIVSGTLDSVSLKFQVQISLGWLSSFYSRWNKVPRTDEIYFVWQFIPALFLRLYLLPSPPITLWLHWKWLFGILATNVCDTLVFIVDLRESKLSYEVCCRNEVINSIPLLLI